MNEKIGVIVPVYKTEKYVAECIESILAQTYTNFRLILVDDGSPDGAGAICDKYATKDPRITVIHQENAGVTRARARGVEEAADCEWITFVDSDDTITADALDSLITANKKEHDIVIAFFEDELYRKNAIIKWKDFVSILLHDDTTGVSMCSKLYRKTLFNETIFSAPKDIIISEDIIANLKLSFSNKKDIAVIKNNIYNYRSNPDSITHTYNINADYAQRLYEVEINTIPIEYRTNFLKDTIGTRLKRYRMLCGYRYNCKDIVCTKFYDNLKKDIETTKYKFPFIDKIIFYSSNCIVRFFAINAKKIQNKLNSLFHTFSKC